MARIFIVHGREEGPKFEIARFLERLGFDVTILHERPNRGRVLITKFQEEAADISFVVVIMTPDDIGGLKDEPQLPRARQNVVFEFGFFIGFLGSDKVCALLAPGVEKPSDIDGVAYISLDQGKGWKAKLAGELTAAGLRFDPERLIGA